MSHLHYGIDSPLGKRVCLLLPSLLSIQHPTCHYCLLLGTSFSPQHNHLCRRNQPTNMIKLLPRLESPLLILGTILRNSAPGDSDVNSSLRTSTLRYVGLRKKQRRGRERERNKRRYIKKIRITLSLHMLQTLAHEPVQDQVQDLLLLLPLNCSLWDYLFPSIIEV